MYQDEFEDARMTLRKYIAGLPRGERHQFRARLAEAHGRSISLIRKWECWPPPGDWDEEKVKRMACKHPADLASIRITEELTNYAVTRKDLRPECWGEEE